MKKIMILLLLFATLAHSVDVSNITTIGQSALRISAQQTYPATIEPGNNDVVLQLAIYHAGDRTYRNITVEAKFQTPFQPVKNTYTIAKMDPQDTYTIIFRFNVDSGTDAGVYTVPLALRYIDTGYREPRPTSDSRDIYLQVSAAPKLEFTGIDIGAPLVNREFTATFTVENSGGLPATDVEAVIVSNTSAYTIWIPDHRTISLIPSGSAYDILFTGRVSSQTEPGAYMGTITLTYSGKTLPNNFVLDIKGVPNVKLAGVATDEDPYPGTKVSLSVQLENTGTGDAKAVKASLSDDSISGLMDSYVGTIEKDDTGSAIFDLTFSKAGINQIPLTIEYEDGSGQLHTLHLTITAYVYAGGGDILPYSIILIIVIVVLYYFFGKKKKHKLLKKLEG